MDDDLGKAEWALALYSVATEQVIAELRPSWVSVVAGLPETRRRTVLRASQQITQHGYPRRRPAASHMTDAALAGVPELGKALTVSEPLTSGDEPPPAPLVSSSLLSVTRSRRWLKVDTQPTYR